MNVQNYDFVSQMIVEDKIKEAMTMLLDPQYKVPAAMRNDVRILLSRYNNLEKQETSGTIDSKDYQLELNRIKVALLNLFSRPSNETNNNNLLRKSLLILLLFSILGSVFWGLSKPQKGFSVKISGFQISRVGFVLSQDCKPFAGQKISGLSLFNFRDITIEADSVSDNMAAFDSSSHYLKFTPMAGIGSVSAYLSAVNLEDLYFQDSALVFITKVEDFPGRFRIQVQQPENFAGRLNFVNNLSLRTNYVEVITESQVLELYDPIKIEFSTTGNTAGEISFSGDQNDFVFGLTLLDSIIEKEIKINYLEFFLTEEQQVKSSVLGGTINLVESDKPVFRSISLNEGDRIDLEVTNDLLINRLRLTKQGIFLDVTGKLNLLNTYQGGERILRNPSRAAWLWHNKKVLLIASVSLIITLIVILLNWMKG